MFEETIQLRVRYHDCDPLGIVYHGHYAKFFEIGRTEAMRKHDFAYKKLEELGFAMPVVEMNIKYFRPARYDELMDIKTIIKDWPDKKIVFTSEIYNQQQQLLTSSETTFVYVKKDSLRRCHIPEIVLEHLKPFFKEELKKIKEEKKAKEKATKINHKI
jgi:acyl-CoA thioester hydrolase